MAERIRGEVRDLRLPFPNARDGSRQCVAGGLPAGSSLRDTVALNAVEFLQANCTGLPFVLRLKRVVQGVDLARQLPYVSIDTIALRGKIRQILLQVLAAILLIPRLRLQAIHRGTNGVPISDLLGEFRLVGVREKQKPEMIPQVSVVDVALKF